MYLYLKDIEKCSKAQKHYNQSFPNPYDVQLKNLTCTQALKEI